MALYFSSISTIFGGPGGPFAMRGTEGFSRRFSSSETESPRTSLLDRRCNGSEARLIVSRNKGTRDVEHVGGWVGERSVVTVMARPSK